MKSIPYIHIWKWIKAFLTNRSANCSYHKRPPSGTKMRLPQDLILAPTLFNLYISNLLQDINGDCTKFADNGTIWHSGKLENLQE